jgi:RNA polymerase sigma-70 factor (ECF subfamily)
MRSNIPFERTVSAPEHGAAQEPPSDEVLATLVASHRRFLRFLERRVESRDAAEEILQAALARAVEKSGAVENAESSVAWFYRMLRNAIIDHYRRRAARERVLQAIATHGEDDPTLDDDLNGEVCACFADLLPTLKPDYADIVGAIDLDGRSVGEMAVELGITANNAGVRLHRARQALRRRLEQTCGTCAEHGCLDCSCGSPVHCGH